MARSRDNEKPAQIIDAAFSAFGNIGYRATLIKDIADRAGISTGTVYTYFKNKRDLFRATVEKGWDDFLEKIRAIVESDDTIERRVERFLSTGFGSLKRYLPLLRGMLFESSQMNLMQGRIEEFCGLVERLTAEKRTRAIRAANDPIRRRFLIRVTVVGVLFSAALAEPAHVDAEIDELKRTITLMLSGG
ncbi:MAG: TetR/AcrR family transcriptional regulator [Spirochaetia bacterium]|jgi:AcrR family transcriptional regulator